MEFCDQGLAALAAFNESDLIQSVSELDSFLFENVDRLDFCDGAKDLHLSSSDGLNNDDWLLPPTELPKFHWEDLFMDDQKQKLESIKEDFPSFNVDASGPLNSSNEVTFSEPSSHEVSTESIENFAPVQPNLFAEYGINAPMLQNVAASPYSSGSHSPETSIGESVTDIPQVVQANDEPKSPLYILGNEFGVVEEVVDGCDTSEACVIHVPVIEEFAVPSITLDSSAELSNFNPCEPDAVFIVEGPPEQQEIVINVNRASVPSKNVNTKLIGSSEVCSQRFPPNKTLKEVLNSEEGDEIAYEFLNSASIDSSMEVDASTIISIPSPSQSSSSSQPSEISDDESLASVSCTSRKSRYSPYSTAERKLRKKEQNKRAALRYRQKKKEDDERIAAEIEKEEARQKELETKYYNTKVQLQFISKMVRDELAKRKKM